MFVIPSINLFPRFTAHPHVCWSTRVTSKKRNVIKRRGQTGLNSIFKLFNCSTINLSKRLASHEYPYRFVIISEIRSAAALAI